MEGYQPQVYQQGFGMPSGQYSTNQMSGNSQTTATVFFFVVVDFAKLKL